MGVVDPDETALSALPDKSYLDFACPPLNLLLSER